MINYRSQNQNILVTGGTSGLGLELVRLLLQDGHNVVATGRQEINMKGYGGKFAFYQVDFSDLEQVAKAASGICRNHSFDVVVNNAGILSPPVYTEANGGIEYSFQINFLTHLLINNIILKGIPERQQIRIIAVTSPVYRLAAPGNGYRNGPAVYRAMRSYSSSKLYQAMMCEFLASRHTGLNLQCCSFNPGTFRSGIYRTQKKWFRVMYKVAAPFMRNPARVAKALKELILNDKIVNGMIYDSFNRRNPLPQMDQILKDSIIKSSYALIDPFMDQLTLK